MTGAEPLSIQELVVALDYGQFILHTAESDPNLGVGVLEEALAGEGIAQRDGLLVVCSPHQNNFKMPLRVEIWSAARRMTSPSGKRPSKRRSRSTATA